MNLLETSGESGIEYANRIRAIHETKIKIQRMRYAGVKNIFVEKTERCISRLHEMKMITNYTEYNSLGRR